MRLASQHLVITKRGRTVEPGPGPREHTLKVVLSALWNLSAHCRKNKVKTRMSEQDLETTSNPWSKLIKPKYELLIIFVSSRWIFARSLAAWCSWWSSSGAAR